MRAVTGEVAEGSCRIGSSLGADTRDTSFNLAVDIRCEHSDKGMASNICIMYLISTN